MTLEEMKNEFMFKYDAASNGAPDLNTYELSLCLTQAAKDIYNTAYSTYETSEISKRIIAPFLERFEVSSLVEENDIFTMLKTYSIPMPDNMSYRIRDLVKLDNCVETPKVIVVDKDVLQEYLSNPFKRPNKRKVLREDMKDNQIKIYSEVKVSNYALEYLSKDTPIIVLDLDLDPTLMGDESIEGLSTASETKIPDIFHDKIINRAVELAILYTRENGLRNQLSV